MGKNSWWNSPEVLIFSGLFVATFSVMMWMASAGHSEILHAQMAKPEQREDYQSVVMGLEKSAKKSAEKLEKCTPDVKSLSAQLQIGEMGEILAIRIQEPKEKVDYSCFTDEIKTWKLPRKQNKNVWLEHHISW